MYGANVECVTKDAILSVAPYALSPYELALKLFKWWVGALPGGKNLYAEPLSGTSIEPLLSNVVVMLVDLLNLNSGISHTYSYSTFFTEDLKFISQPSVPVPAPTPLYKLPVSVIVIIPSA